MRANRAANFLHLPRVKELAGILTVFLLIGNSASAQQVVQQSATFGQAMLTMAESVRDFMTAQGGSLAKIEKFEPDDESDEVTKGVSGEKIQLALLKAFEKCNGKLVPKGQWAVRGTYACQTTGGMAHVSITAVVVTNSDMPIAKRQFFLKKAFKIEALDEVIQLSGGVSFDATPPKPAGAAAAPLDVPGTYEREKAAALAIASPRIAVRDNLGSQSIISPRSDSKFSIEMCRVENGRATALAAAVQKEGSAEISTVFVGKNDKFAVRIRNGAKHGVGIRLLIDGISMFQFSEEYRTTAETQLLYVDAGQTAIIPGWHINNKVSKEFQIVDLPDSVYATILEEQRQPDRLGTVTVEFFPAWEQGKQRPIASKGSTEKSVATGAGALIDVPYQVKHVEFDVYPIAAVSTRYKLDTSGAAGSAPPTDLPPPG
jgi:hypothetical protein